MVLAAALTPYVPATIRERGRDYYRTGAVRIHTLSASDVYAVVTGSSRYDVDLLLEGQTIFASCTCPYGDEYSGVCKHIWATILAAEPRGFAATAVATGRLELVLDGDSDYDHQPQPVLQPVRPPPAPRRERWTDQLAALRREVEPLEHVYRSHVQRADRQFLYVFDAPASVQAKKLVLELNLQDRKKNGEWGKPKVQNLSPHDLGSLTHPLDQRLYTLLGGAERVDNYGNRYSMYAGYGTARYRLSGPLLDTLLPMLAESGRVRLRRDTKPPVVLEDLTPDLDSLWELSVGVSRSDDGKSWVLGGHLSRGDETTALTKPDLLVPGLLVAGGRFARFDDGGASGWIPTLRRVGSIAVPIAKADDLLTQLFQMPKLPRLVLPEELHIAEETVTPKPRLLVKPVKSYYGGQQLHAELSFDYDGVVIPEKPATRGVFQPDRKRFLLRDADAEQAALRELTRHGARPAWSGRDHVLELKPAVLPKLVRQLVAAGWNIEADGKLYRKASAFELKVSTENDWFDLNAVAHFDGRPVPFPRLLEALRRGDASVLLDDGSLGLLPEDWLAKYGLLAQMGTVEGDKVRFGKAQIGVLDALLASRPDVTFDKQFARARDQLRKFEGIEPDDPPASFVGQLREYQREGLGWLRFLRKFGFGGCLADDMGLGKTIQVLALLAGKRSGPALVVVPKSLVFNWKQEAARFTPKLKVLDHTGPTRDKSGAAFPDYDIVLTTYGTLRNDATMFSAFRFDTCILDESQAAKNAETETAKAVRVVQADHRLALSGTPVENHLGELWTLFDFLNPGMLGRAMLTNTGSIRNPDGETREFLAKALKPFILRRTKDQVAKDLPAKTEQTVYCDLEPAQRKLYDELRDHYRQSLLSRVDTLGLGRSKIQVLEALLRLRQAACHPGLIDKARTAEASAKLDVLLPQLAEVAESGCKSLVFSQFTSLLAIVRNRLGAEKVPYEYLDGRTRDRAARVERFQTDPACRLFLVSLKAGGVGLNLTAAEYVFLLDLWWNPAVEAQAIDRSHRIGQTKPVFAYRLIARDTVEEKVLALQQSKRELADAILGGDGRLISDLKREDLEMLLS